MVLLMVSISSVMDLEVIREEIGMTGMMKKYAGSSTFGGRRAQTLQIFGDDCLGCSPIMDRSHDCTTTVRAISNVLRQRMGLYGGWEVDGKKSWKPLVSTLAVASEKALEKGKREAIGGY